MLRVGMSHLKVISRTNDMQKRGCLWGTVGVKTMSLYDCFKSLTQTQYLGCPSLDIGTLLPCYLLAQCSMIQSQIGMLSLRKALYCSTGHNPHRQKQRVSAFLC